MRRLYAGRMALYAAAAELVIDEEQTTPELIALRIVAALETERRHHAATR